MEALSTGFPGRMKCSSTPVGISPGIEGFGDELRPMVHHETLGQAAHGGQLLEHLDHPGAGQRGIYRDHRTAPEPSMLFHTDRSTMIRSSSRPALI
jgi:hypothetical protein